MKQRWKSNFKKNVKKKLVKNVQKSQSALDLAEMLGCQFLHLDTSVPLAEELNVLCTGVCGTIISNRKGMPNMSRSTNLPLKKGKDPVFFEKENILVCCWHDTKRLTMISTFRTKETFVEEIRSKNSETGNREILKPTCVEATTNRWEE